MSNPIIIVDNIHKSIKVTSWAKRPFPPCAASRFLSIQAGEFVCLMGPSGSGKTTLLNIIGGLDEPSRGHVTVEGENLVALSEDELAKLRLNKMGFVFQNYNLLGNFTALQSKQITSRFKEAE